MTYFRLELLADLGPEYVFLVQYVSKLREAWAKGCELVQIWTGLHLTMPYEPYRPISNQYFQIFVIYLEDVQQDSPSFTNKDQG